MDNNLKYKSLDYWNERYKDEEHFEWFGDYSMFKPIISLKLKHSDKILVLGCGNSRMSEEMYLDNYTNIVNTDYSPVIVDLMRKRCERMSLMSWEIMDIYQIHYEKETFECVLEKGTLDALLVDEKDPWRLSEENTKNIDKILEKISYVLKNDGVFISITFAQPHFRKPLYALDKYNWSVELFTIGETFHYFVYVMTKGQKLNDTDKFFYCRQNLNNSYLKKDIIELKANDSEDFLNNLEID